MDQTPELQLPVLGPEDYANVPLYLQRLAEAVEEEAGLVEDDVQAAYGRMAAIWTNDAVDGPILASPLFGPLFLSTTPYVVYSNYEVPQNSFAAFKPLIGGTRRTFAGPGIYQLTWSVTLTPVGAITADSWRSVVVNVVRFVDSTWEIVADLGVRGVIETETQQGRTSLNGDGVFEVGDDYASTFVSIVVQHSNAASSLQVPIGGAFFGLRMLGTPDVIEVV